MWQKLSIRDSINLFRNPAQSATSIDALSADSHQATQKPAAHHQSSVLLHSWRVGFAARIRLISAARPLTRHFRSSPSRVDKH
ncbi:hypothetical protein RJ55_06628 [Drechmeria coniospora]|nr:hypothetical protein RJ55_06628 [Drechmeria coniospora]